MRMLRTTRANSACGSSAFRLASPSAIHEAPVALSPSKPVAQSRNSRQACASSVEKPASYHSCVTSGGVSGAPEHQHRRAGAVGRLRPKLRPTGGRPLAAACVRTVRGGSLPAVSAAGVFVRAQCRRCGSDPTVVCGTGVFSVLFRVLLRCSAGTGRCAAGAGSSGAAVSVRAAVYAVPGRCRFCPGMPRHAASAAPQTGAELADAAVLCVCASDRYGGGVRHCTKIFCAYFGAYRLKKERGEGI